ncbi:hypothetical protein SAMN05216266_114167 [Amycolatopsis marina]|uniref:Uncharacterized protein n=1 Tax=Amycolatopsis marina TaxID=490629 RepID=A0A1I1BNH8_9PSEU|nr:hypothetical protein [Amycolatopsis marina]SFB50288.1 hypothetical protein SAMN05216266_114167 [Amycolatopsis marina]
MYYRTDIKLAAAVAAFASAGAAVIHLAVTPDHWREWAPSGLFFAGLALLQLGWAVAVLRSAHRAVLGIGVVANTAAIALWVVTRTNGLPFGPHADIPESLGPAGILATVLELVVVLGAAWGMLPREHASKISVWRYRFALGGAAMLVAAVMAPGVVAGLDHAHGGAEHDSHGEPGTGGHHGTTSTPEPVPGGSTATRRPTTSESSHSSGHSDGHSH